MAVLSSWSDLCARAERYGPQVNAYDWLKFVAIVLMTLDHVGAYLLPDGPLWWRAMGRTAAPIFLFLAGYSQSRRWNSEILWLALALQLVNLLTFQGLNPLNILFTILIGRYAVRWLQQRGWTDRYPMEIFAASIILTPFANMLFEYGTLGFLIILMGHQAAQGGPGRSYPIYALLTAGLYSVWQFFWFDFTWMQGVFAVAAILLTFWGLARFRQPGAIPARLSPTASLIIRFLARNSLHYYVFHRILFQLAALMAGITPTGAFPVWIF